MFNRAALFATSIAGMAMSGAFLLLGPDGAEAAPTVEPTPAVAPMGWHLVHEGPRAKLAYGAENSDHILFMLSCAPGEGVVDVFGMAAPEADGLTLASTRGRSALDARPEVDPMTGAMMVETRVRLNAPALEGFRETGALTLAGASGRPMALNANVDEQVGVEAFFAHCSGSRA